MIIRLVYQFAQCNDLIADVEYTNMTTIYHKHYSHYEGIKFAVTVLAIRIH